jgi:hypothetical protein
MKKKITFTLSTRDAGLSPRIWNRCLGFIFQILLLSLVFEVGAYAQNGIYEISFGSAVNNTTQQKAGITPFAKGRRDTRSQYLYLASELSGTGATAGTISSIAFNVTNLNGAAQTLTDVNIYLSATSVTELVDAANGMPAPNANTPNKHLATLSITETGWVSIVLDTPFQWNGTSNVIVEICKSNSSKVANNYSVQASQGNGFVTRARYTFADNLSNHVPGCSMTTYTNSGNNVTALTASTDRKTRPDIRFTFACNGNPTAGVAVNKNPGSKCLGDVFNLEVEDGESSSGLQYQWQLSTDNGLTFSNIDQAVGQTLQATQGINKIYYRRQTKCGGYSVNSAACMVDGLNRWNGTAWSRGTAPLTDETAVIDGDFNCQNLELCSLVVLSGNMTVQSGYTLIVGKQVAVYGGSVTFEDSATLIQQSASEANFGSITYKRNSQPVRRYDFTYWSSPVQDQQLLALSPNTQPDKFYSWNHSTNSWFAEPNTNLMQPAKGYIIRAPQTFSISGSGQVFNAAFVGKPNNGQITTPLSSAGQWNLIGNPYPSALYARDFLNNASNSSALDGTVYFWTHNTSPSSSAPGSSAFNYSANDYATWNFTGGVGMGHPADSPGNTNAPDGYIAAGQSFMVKSLAGGIATFENSMRRGSGNGNFFRTSEVDDNIHRFWLQLANATGFKQTLVGYLDGATDGLDWGYDGDAMDGAVVSFYSLVGDHALGIQGLALPFDGSGQVPMGFKTTAAGEQQISLIDYDGLFTDQDIFIEDTYSSVIHNLSDGVYTFTSPAGTFNDRFIIRYSNSILGVDGTDARNIVVYAQQKNVMINSGNDIIDTVSIFDLTGRLLFTKSGYMNSQINVNGNDWTSQVLIVRMLTFDKTVITRKIIF